MTPMAFTSSRTERRYSGKFKLRIRSREDILMDGRLYFKTDEQTRTAYVERRMGPFIYEKARRTLTINYFEVPPDVLESREDLAAWAQRAIQARAAKLRKSARRSK